MTQWVAVKERVVRLSEDGADGVAEETDGRISLSRLLGMLRRRDRHRTQSESGTAKDSAGTITAQSPSAVVTQLEADIAELEKRLQALGGEEPAEAEEARMLRLLLRNRKDVLERAKARKFLLDGASYGVK